MKADVPVLVVFATTAGVARVTLLSDPAVVNAAKLHAGLVPVVQTINRRIREALKPRGDSAHSAGRNRRAA